MKSSIYACALAAIAACSANDGASEIDAELQEIHEAQAAGAPPKELSPAAKKKLISMMREKLLTLPEQERPMLAEKIAKMEGKPAPKKPRKTMQTARGAIAYTVSDGLARNGDIVLGRAEEVEGKGFGVTNSLIFDLSGETAIRPAWMWLDLNTVDPSFPWIPAAKCEIPLVEGHLGNQEQTENWQVAKYIVESTTPCRFRPAVEGDYYLYVLNVELPGDIVGQASLGRTCWYNDPFRPLDGISCNPNWYTGEPFSTTLIGDGDLKVWLHELWHILGAWHEHERPDRDQYVVTDDLPKFQWDDTQNWRPASYAYDTSSVTHYEGVCHYYPVGLIWGIWACHGLAYPVGYDGKVEFAPALSRVGVGGRSYPSQIDIDAINQLYRP